MGLSIKDLTPGRLYKGRSFGFRLLVNIDGDDVEYRYCTEDRDNGGLKFDAVERCRKNTFYKWGGAQGGVVSGYDEDAAYIFSISNPNIVGSSRGEIELSAKARFLTDVFEDLVNDVTKDCREKLTVALEALKDVQAALAGWRDGEETYEHPEHGKLSLEEVKYCIVDQAITFIEADSREG
jgi:hypothetical protein